MIDRANGPRLLLHNRSFAALWSSEFISTIGDRIHRVALAALVYQLTGSLTQTGIAFLATGLPDLLFGLLAGVYVDRWDRRKILILCDFLRIPVVLLVPFIAYTSLPAVYLLLFVLNTMTIIYRPAKTALIPSVVEPEELNSANSLTSLSENVSDVLGYPLAGALIGGMTLWLGAEAALTMAFAVDALTYLISGLLVLLVRRTDADRTGHQVSSIWGDLQEGIRFVRRSQVLRSNTLIMLLGPLILGAATTLLVGFAWDVLDGGEWEYAMLGTGISLGSILGGIWLSSGPRFSSGILVIAGLVIMGLSVMATSLAENLWLAVLVIGFSGFGSMMVLIPSVTLVQRHTPDRLLGRVFSLRSTLIFGAIIVSNAAGGWAGETFGVRETFFVCGVLLVVISAVAATFPSVRQVDAPPMITTEQRLVD